MLDVNEDVRNEFKVKLIDKFEEEVLLFFFLLFRFYEHQFYQWF